jgi:hypothetical protein
MSSLKGTIRNGQVVLEKPAAWPDGTAVNVARAATPQETEGACDPTEEDWSNTPEAIAEWLAWYRSLEPLLLTPAEEADTEAWLRKVNDYGVAKMQQGSEEVAR